MSPPVASATTENDDESFSQLTETVPHGPVFDPSYRCSEDDDDVLLAEANAQMTQECDKDDIITPQAPKKARVSSVSDSNVSESNQLSDSISDEVDALCNSTGTPSPNANRGIPPTCAANLQDCNNSKGVLLAMCVGLDSNNKHFAVYADDPNYNAHSQKTNFKTTKAMYIEEVKRRHRLIKGPDKTKHCKSYSVQQLVDYLVANPITNPVDVAFLKREEAAFRATLDAADKERTALSDLHTGEAWCGNKPWLRLYHTITSHRVLPVYMDIDKWEGRSGIDARNSEKRIPSFYEVAAEVYNDPDYVVTTFAYANVHSDYSQRFQIKVGDPDIPLVTPDKIKKKLAEAKALLSKLVADWEASGNGSGQRDPNQLCYGHVSEDTLFLNVEGNGDSEFMDGDNRSSFLRGRKSHLLYMWELFDIYDILTHTLHKLSEAVSVDSEHVPKACEDGKKGAAKKNEQNEKNKLQEDFVQTATKAAHAMETLAKRQVDSQILSFECHLIMLQDKLEIDGRTEEQQQEYQQQINRVKRRIDSLYRELDNE